MAWFKLFADFKKHRKLHKLGKLLGIPPAQTRGLLVGLFCDACDSRPDGHLTNWTAEDVAYACDWESDPHVLVHALTKSGFLDIDEFDKTYQIHNWMKYAESYKVAQRVRKHREKERAGKKPDDLPPDCNVTVPLQLRDSAVTVTPERRGEERRINRSVKRESANAASVNDLSLFSETGEQAPKTGAGGIFAVVQDVWQHYRTRHPKARKVLEGHRKEYKDCVERLKEFQPSEIKSAIDGFHKSPWHLGDNPQRTTYLSFGLIVRSAANIERGMELDSGGTTKQRPRQYFG